MDVNNDTLETIMNIITLSLFLRLNTILINYDISIRYHLITQVLLFFKQILFYNIIQYNIIYCKEENSFVSNTLKENKDSIKLINSLKLNV